MSANPDPNLAIGYAVGVLDAVQTHLRRCEWLTALSCALAGLAVGLGTGTCAERAIGNWMLAGVVIVLFVVSHGLARLERRRWKREVLGLASKYGEGSEP